jgi:hypothetical protein
VIDKVGFKVFLDLILILASREDKAAILLNKIKK